MSFCRLAGSHVKETDTSPCASPAKKKQTLVINVVWAGLQVSKTNPHRVHLLQSRSTGLWLMRFGQGCR